MRQFQLPALALLAGCATGPVPPFQPGAATIRLTVAAAESALRRLSLEVQGQAVAPDFAGASALLDQARVTVATESVLGSADFAPALAAERALLGVTLKVCADGVETMQAEPGAAASFARGPFGVTCLLPLSLFAMR